jgi:molybdopterin synthase catalytic subunit
VRVIVATGNLRTSERFVEEVARHGTIAIIKRTLRSKVRCGSLDGVKEVLCVQSSAGCSFRNLDSDYERQIAEELDRLAEQEEVDFAIVLCDELPSRLTAMPEVYKASLALTSEELRSHIQLLNTMPEWMTLKVVIKNVKSNPLINKAGAILTFTGIVRDDANALLFDIYEGEAQKRIEAIANDLRRLEGIVDVRMHHRSGRIHLGEDIVYIVVAASHRQEGFAALKEAIERIKSEVPIWKKELTEAGGRWVGV